MIDAYFLVAGRKFNYNVIAGLTCARDIKGFAEYMGWKSWEFNCPSIGLFIKQ